ncbi:zinc-binding protein A33-like [Callorhinchus milii]|uniref:zinc-binding protein A33 n=1 Tax=Callorhinchus milii TaxID=7868 RepID=UPI001C3F771B|nr:zinc-binding protein A33 [Callorhinchus milii]XP_042200824.1 zinc-binding protein A33-like [Callorhinchus milii]
MSSRGQKQKWTEELNCPICLEIFTEPVTLKCGHNFCRFCITHSWSEQLKGTCPECREVNSGNQLKPNRTLVNLSNEARELKSPQNKEMRDCDKHSEELKLFCETDKKLICIMCLIDADGQSHKSHDLMLIEKAAEIYKDKLKSSFDPVIKRNEAVLLTESEQKEKISALKEQVSRLAKHVTAEFGKMHQSLYDREQRVIRELRQREQEILQRMEKNLGEIRGSLVSLQQKFSELKKQMEKDAFTFLRDENTRKRRVSEEYVKLSLSEGDLPVGIYTGPVQYAAWRDMRHIISPGKYLPFSD